MIEETAFTSGLAYRYCIANDIFNKIDPQIIDVLATGPQTMVDVGYEIEQRTRGALAIRSVSPRFAVLRRKGVIEAAGRARSRNGSGQLAVLWKPTWKAPDKSQTRAHKRTHGEQAFLKLEAENISLKETIKRLKEDVAAATALLYEVQGLEA